MFKRSALTVFAIAAALSAGYAMAASGLYGVVGVGRSNIDVDPVRVNAFASANGVPSPSTAVDSKSVGWKLQLGYPISNTVALEGGYMSLGKAKFTHSNTLFTTTGSRSADLFNLDFVGKIPVNDALSLLARIGGYRWESTSDLPVPTGLTNRVDNGFDFKFGVGVQYDFTKQLGLRGSYDRFNGIGSTSTAGDSKANLLSVDAVLKF